MNINWTESKIRGRRISFRCNKINYHNMFSIRPYWKKSVISIAKTRLTKQRNNKAQYSKHIYLVGSFGNQVDYLNQQILRLFHCSDRNAWLLGGQNKNIGGTKPAMVSNIRYYFWAINKTSDATIITSSSKLISRMLFPITIFHSTKPHIFW